MRVAHSGLIPKIPPPPTNLFSILAQTSPKKALFLTNACTHTHLYLSTFYHTLYLPSVYAWVCEIESKREVQLNPRKRDIIHIHTHRAYGVIIAAVMWIWIQSLKLFLCYFHSLQPPCFFLLIFFEFIYLFTGTMHTEHHCKRASVSPKANQLSSLGQMLY